MRHPRLIATLVSIILVFVLLELALQVFDPLQVKPYFADLRLLFASMTAYAPRAYVLTPGEYQFSNWSMTVNADSTRLVPDTHPSDCIIAFVGDSVTMGHGVDDNETWVNLMAQRFPDVQMVNEGVNGYNAVQALATIRESRFDGFFYTLIANDADRILDWQHKPSHALYEPILPVYLYVLGNQQEQAVLRDLELFDAALESMKQMANVAIVAFEGDELAARAGVAVVPTWTHVNSPTDTHANAAGNVEIADAMMPYVENLIEQVC